MDLLQVETELCLPHPKGGIRGEKLEWFEKIFLRRKYVDGEPVGARHIHCNEFHVAVHQAGNEMDVAGKPVKLGDDQNRAAFPALCKRRMELGPVLLASALHFDELRGKLVLACHEAGHGFTLRVHAKPLDAWLSVDTR